MGFLFYVASFFMWRPSLCGFLLLFAYSSGCIKKVSNNVMRVILKTLINGQDELGKIREKNSFARIFSVPQCKISKLLSRNIR